MSAMDIIHFSISRGLDKDLTQLAIRMFNEGWYIPKQIIGMNYSTQEEYNEPYSIKDNTMLCLDYNEDLGANFNNESVFFVGISDKRRYGLHRVLLRFAMYYVHDAVTVQRILLDNKQSIVESINTEIINNNL